MQVLTFSYLFLKARCKKASAVRPNLMQLINLSSTTWFVAVESFGHLKVHRERTSASQTFCCRWGRLRRRKSHFFKTWQLLLRCFCGHSPPPPPSDHQACLDVVCFQLICFAMEIGSFEVTVIAFLQSLVPRTRNVRNFYLLFFDALKIVTCRYLVLNLTTRKFVQIHFFRVSQ